MDLSDKPMTADEARQRLKEIAEAKQALISEKEKEKQALQEKQDRLRAQEHLAKIKKEIREKVELELTSFCYGKFSRNWECPVTQMVRQELESLGYVVKFEYFDDDYQDWKSHYILNISWAEPSPPCFL